MAWRWSAGRIATAAIVVLAAICETAAHGQAEFGPGEIDVRLEWRRGILGVGIGLSGLHAADLDGDGRIEIVAGGGKQYFFRNRFWYLLQRRRGRFEQTWVSPWYREDIRTIALGQLDSDPATEVIIGVGTRIEVYDGATLTIERSFPTIAAEIRSLKTVDVDSDGDLEFVFCDQDALYVYDVATGTLEFRGAGWGGYDLAVGNVDADSALEIVIGNDGGYPGYVIDGQTRLVEWENPLGFGYRVRLGDLEGDGVAEIFAGYSWYTILVFDGRDRVLLRSFDVDYDLAAMELIDIDGGAVELIYADGQWGGIHILNATTGREKRMVRNPDHGVTNLTVADVDQDGNRELVWGAGFSSTGADHLYVFDLVTGRRDWRSRDITGPFFTFAADDIDADGDPELAYTVYESEAGYQDGILYLHDAVTRVVERLRRQTPEVNLMGLTRVATANVDRDGQLEVFVGSGSGYRGLVVCYDGRTYEEQWRASLEEGLEVRALQVADLDGDGRKEVIVGSGRQHTGAPGVFVYVFDGRTGRRKWRSPHLPSGWGDLALMRVAQVDADANPEIVVAHVGGHLFVIDGLTGAVSLPGDQQTTALATPDLDGDGTAEVVIGTSGGDLRSVDPETGAVRQVLGSFGGRIDGLAFHDLNGDSVLDYVFAVADSVRIVDGVSGMEVRTSGVIGESVGRDDSITVVDYDRDGRLELLVNTGLAGFSVYEVAPAPP